MLERVTEAQRMAVRELKEQQATDPRMNKRKRGGGDEDGDNRYLIFFYLLCCCFAFCFLLLLTAPCSMCGYSRF